MTTADSPLGLVLSLGPTERRQIIQSALQGIEAGTIDPLALHIRFKYLIKLLEDLEASAAYKTAILDEAKKHEGSTLLGATASVKELGIKYDYSQCGDIDLINQLDVYESLGKAIKKRQEFLRTIPLKGLTTVDDVTGEVNTLYPPTKTSTTGVVVNLAKQ